MNPWEVVLGISLKATIILSAGCGLALALRRASAAVRCAIWTASLAGVLVLPLLIPVVPAFDVPVGAAEPAVTMAPPPAGTPAPAPVPRRELPIWWVLGVGTMAVAMSRAAGVLRMRRYVRAAAALTSPEWAGLLAEFRAKLGLRRQTRLLASAAVDVPVTLGVWRPAILLPVSAAEWPDDRKRIVLLHELIHIRRRDALARLAAQASCALYWFHPLAWFVASRLRADQEHACDDAVLNFGTKGSVYAEHLISLARGVKPDGRPWVPAVGMAENAGLESRVVALLDPRRNRRGLSRTAAAAVCCLAIAAAVPLAALRAQASKATATLLGTVSDASGARVPGATVLLKSVDSAAEEITTTNPAGEFSLRRIPAGKYDVEIAARGFKLYRRPGLVLAPDAADRFTATLEIGQVSERVDVVAHAPRAPEVPGGSPQRVRVGGNVQATRLVKMARPEYPPAAKAAGIEGTVLLRAVISKEGVPLNLSVINTAEPELARAAMDAVSQWRYQPTLLNGEPVEVVTTVTVNFRLE